MSETTAPPAATPPATPTPTPAPAPTPTPTPPAAPATDPAWDGKVESLPEPAQKLIADLRKENADRRTKATAAEQAQQAAIRELAKAAGIDLPGGPATPEDLAAQLQAAQADATGRDTALRDMAVRLAVFETAALHGANPGALTDSRAFLAKVADLDPKAEDFTTRIVEAAKTAAEANPTLKAQPPAGGASTIPGAGGSGEGPSKPSTLEDAIAKKMAH